MQATVAKLNNELVKNQENSKLVSQKVTAAEEASRDLSDQLNKRTAELQVCFDWPVAYRFVSNLCCVLLCNALNKEVQVCLDWPII